ncbi:hypothetical protein B0J12DRAFT_317138 [Macrophomina phaseolina]|uniref:Uncharacterized protein n=1 Tax=Macrophomina phaseolina TaxID=35725 RepID=A0ABQ8FW57_9PEZI|nr:hypothetical protein B0J12DRAFT_317138 [Macrophomina phaseolina]
MDARTQPPGRGVLGGDQPAKRLRVLAVDDARERARSARVRQKNSVVAAGACKRAARAAASGERSSRTRFSTVDQLIIAVQAVLEPAVISAANAIVLFAQGLSGAIFVSVANNVLPNQLPQSLRASGVPATGLNQSKYEVETW